MLAMRNSVVVNISVNNDYKNKEEDKKKYNLQVTIT